jgi:hypothetical protein
MQVMERVGIVDRSSTFSAVKKEAGNCRPADRREAKKKSVALIYFPEPLPAFFAAVWANKK